MASASSAAAASPTGKTEASSSSSKQQQQPPPPPPPPPRKQWYRIEDYYPPDETPDDHVDSLRYVYVRGAKGTAALETAAIIALSTELTSHMNAQEAAIMQWLHENTLRITRAVTENLTAHNPRVLVPLLPTTAF